MTSTMTSKHFKGGTAAGRMSTSNSPSPTKEDTTPTFPVQTQDFGENRLESRFAEITKMSATLQGVAADILTIKVTTTVLKNAVNNIHERLEEMEVRVSILEDTSDRLVNGNDDCDKKVEVLLNHLEELENHSKRNNVRLVGLRETYGTNGTMELCVRNILREGLGVDVDGEFEVESAPDGCSQTRRGPAAQTGAY